MYSRHLEKRIQGLPEKAPREKGEHDVSKTGQHDQALADLSKAIEIDASNALAYFLRGAVHAEIGEREKAISDLERALELGLDPSLEQNAEALLEELGQ